eukprot:2374537-Rhodomonas_salina.3
MPVLPGADRRVPRESRELRYPPTHCLRAVRPCCTSNARYWHTHAKYGTNSTGILVRYAMCGPSIGDAPLYAVLTYAMLLPEPKTARSAVLPAYARPTRCPVLS